MQLEEKYELLEAVGELSGDRDQTIPAWERSTGKQVFVHLLAGGYSAENNVLLTAVGRLSPEHRQHVLGAGDHLGNAYVITDALPWGVSLRNWITSMRAKSEAPPSPAPDAAHPALDDSKLTRAGTWRIPAFNAGAKVEPAEARPSAQTPPGPPQVDPDRIETAAMGRPEAGESQRIAPLDLPAAVPEREPGEFTRLMRAGGAEPPASPKTPAPAPSASPASEVGPGEFTRLMRAGKPNPPGTAETPGTAPAAPAAPDTKPGEFTQLLRSFKPEPSGSSAVPVQRVTPPPETVRSADEIMPPMQPGPQFPDVPLTQPPLRAPQAAPPPPAEIPWQFDKPSGPAAPPAPPAAPGGQGAFTQMFRGQPQYPQTPAPGMSAPPAAPQGEGEFTRMMRTPAAPAGGVFAPPPRGGPADADLFTTPGQSAPGAKGGPSFTQVISARNPVQPAAAASTPAPKEPAQAKSKPPYLVLGIVLGLLFVLLIALVLILVLRR